MKNKVIIILLTVSVFFSGCNYLDIVPDDKPTLEDAFKTENQAEKFLYGLYSYIPNILFFQNSPFFDGADEIVSSKSTLPFYYPAKAWTYNQLSSSDPWFNYWSSNVNTNTSSRSIVKDLYAGIRQCYIFLNRLETVPNLSQERKLVWTSEAKFLIAFYHYFLMECYGPIIIVDREISINAPQSEILVGRSPYDECVNFVVRLLDEAANGLPDYLEAYSDFGKPTSIAAKALKSRVLITAASPLWNGNSEFYAEFKNNDGTQLVSQTYDASKWERARIAAQEAILLAKNQGGRELYKSTAITSADPFEQGKLNYRYLFVDKWNTEIIWGLTESQVRSYHEKHLAPRIVNPQQSNGPIGILVPTFTTVEMYYTKNGLPLDVDPETKDKDMFIYSPAAGTALINTNREPRFYASIGYDGGKYEFNGTTFDLDVRAGKTQGFNGTEYYSQTGYFSKKWVHPRSTFDNVANRLTTMPYPVPYIRLAELYLNYAEADFEYDRQLSSVGEGYLNEIRNRSGVPSLEQAWSKVGGLPSSDETRMRELIQRERSVEMLMECRRFFDLRRWKTAHVELNKPQYAWDIYASTTSGFYKKTKLEESGLRSFVSPRNYLFPIHINNLNVNNNLVQNPDW